MHILGQFIVEVRLTDGLVVVKEVETEAVLPVLDFFESELGVHLVGLVHVNLVNQYLKVILQIVHYLVLHDFSYCVLHHEIG